MADIFGFLYEIAGSLWRMLLDSAFLLLIGIFLAGVIRAFLDSGNIGRFLTGSRNSVVFKAALFGIPLPLCSCSVLPVVHQLRQSGLNKGGTTAFLISTPETGADSILLTYSLTDPLMTVARPITAFATALTAGLFVNLTADGPEPEPLPQVACECENCGCQAEDPRQSAIGRLPASIKYAFTDLLSDLAPYLLVGYLLAGVVAALLGDGMANIPELFKTGWGGYVGALVVGLPLYICATSSTPLAAVLLGAGFSPGAILVFLMVGPATNIASLTVVGKILKGWSMAKYLLTIVVVSIIFGIVTDLAYELTGLEAVYAEGQHADHAGIVAILSSVILSLFVCWYSLRKLVRRIF